MRYFAVVSAVLVASLLANPALAQQKEWDQKAVTALVEELVTVISTVQVEAKTTDNIASDEAREFVIEDLALLKKNARSLAQELRSGKDQTASFPRAKRVGSLVQRTRANAAKAMLSPSNSAEVARANELIAEIGTFYRDYPDVAAPPPN
jgi:hypothetical protein